jgi:hypothetical protein
MIREG